MHKFFKYAIVDFIMILFMGMVSHWLIYAKVHEINLIFLISVAVFFIFALLLSKFYRFRVKDSSLDLLGYIATAYLPVTSVLVLVTGLKFGFTEPTTRWIILYCTLSFVIVVASRVGFRFAKEVNSRRGLHRPKALVYGAGDTGTTIARMSAKGHFDYEIVGFVDDEKGLEHEIVLGVPILGKLKDLDRVMKERSGELECLIIAISKISSENLHDAIVTAKKNNLEVKIVPNLFETKGRADVSVREINYADLLGRSLITIEKEPLFDMFQGKTILVTGAGGSIGSEISKQLLEFGPKKLIVLDIDETELHDLCLRLLDYESEWSDKVVPVVCDIKNKEKIAKIFSEQKPDIVFHAAAYKHVPLMELYPEEAILTNITGSYNVFKAASDNNVDRVVVISTDKAVNPTNIMGATKRVVEMTAAAFNQNSKTDFCCVRFGNVIGSRGSMLPLFLEEIRAGKPITVTDRNIIRYFMAIPEAVSLVFRAATLAQGGEVMVLDMGEPVKIYDFAKKLIDVFGDGRSEIRITGLRPGEKLYEELLANKDNTIPTVNEKIFKAKVNNKDTWSLEYLETVMKRLVTESPEQLVKELQETVPEFHRALNKKKTD